MPISSAGPRAARPALRRQAPRRSCCAICRCCCAAARSPLQETGALRGFGKILYFTASPDPVWRSLTAGAEPVLLLCGVPEQPDVRCICYTKKDYAAALQQLEL